RLGDKRPGRGGPDLGAPAVRLLPEGPPAEFGWQKLIARERRMGGALLPQGNRDDPRLAPHLAVADDVEPHRLLQGDDLAYGTVLHLVQGGGAYPALAHSLPRFPEIGRP